MRFTTITSALVLGASAAAFSDTSPLVFLSTAKLEQRPDSTQQLMTSSAATQLAQDLLTDCPTTRYLVVSQPNVNAADLTTPAGACAVPNLCRAVGSARVLTTTTVAEVFGAVSAEDLAGFVRTTCKLAGKQVDVEQVVLPALPVVSRAQVLADNDYLLRSSLEKLESGDSYTIVYLAGPKQRTHEAELEELGPMDLKKRINAAARHLRRDLSSNRQQSLFDKYQFFTPGIFASLLVAVLLLTILTAGIKGLASLEVPYAAFDKEMGPAAQKKQQ